MQGLTWADLLSPEYMMTFWEGFLLAAVPALGLGNGVQNGGTIDVTVPPNLVLTGGAIALGLLGGIRSLRNLRAPSPTPRGQTSTTTTVPTPPAGG
jgi:hypothetical protein